MTDLDNLFSRHSRQQMALAFLFLSRDQEEFDDYYDRITKKVHGRSARVLNRLNELDINAEAP